MRLPIPPITTITLDAVSACMTRVRTHLTTFIEDGQIDRCEAEVMAAMNELRMLRMQLRGMRAQARAARRAA